MLPHSTVKLLAHHLCMQGERWIIRYESNTRPQCTTWIVIGVGNGRMSRDRIHATCDVFQGLFTELRGVIGSWAE